MTATTTNPDVITTATATARLTDDTDVAPDAAGTGALVPYITVRGAAAAIDWYRRVFGARELVRYTGDDGAIGHAELTIGTARLMLSDEYLEYGAASPDHLGGTIGRAQPRCARRRRRVRARRSRRGRLVRREPTDQPYGERSCQFVDPWGHRWMVQTTDRCADGRGDRRGDGRVHRHRPPAQPTTTRYEPAMRAHDPSLTYLHLGIGPEMQLLPVTDDFWSTIDDRTDLHTGRLVTGMANDTDWPVWEMHPVGDELVVVTSGSVRFHLDDGTSVSTLTVAAPEYIVVPAGMWHTADTLGPAQLLIVTWGEGTEHRPR